MEDLIFFEILITTSVSHQIETSQSICRANQVTGFYMMGTLVDNGLKKSPFYFKQNLPTVVAVAKADAPAEDKI